MSHKGASAPFFLPCAPGARRPSAQRLLRRSASAPRRKLVRLRVLFRRPMARVSLRARAGGGGGNEIAEFLLTACQGTLHNRT